MKPTRHLIIIVFLLCGLTALGSERAYDRKDLVGTYKYNDTKEYVLNLHLHSDNTFMVSSAASDDSFRHFGNWVKELEILDKNNLFWGYHLQEGYKKVKGLYPYGKPVFYNGKNYITPDRDGHNGGVWKMAKKEKDLYNRNTRMGTYDAELNKIGD